jgi:hypothetical protein
MAAIDTDTMIEELRVHLGLDKDDETDLPREDALLLLNRSFWELNSKGTIRTKEVKETFDTVAGQRLYDGPETMEALNSLSITNPDTGQHTTLDMIEPFVYENLYNESEDAQGFPEKYMRRGCVIYLWPTPDDVYELTIHRWDELENISDTNDAHVIREYQEVILFGGVWRGQVRQKDYEAAETMQKFQGRIANGIKPVELKEKADTHRSGVDVLWTAHPSRNPRSLRQSRWGI